MNSDNLLLARELLLELDDGDFISTQYNHESETRTGYSKYPSNVIEWLVNSNLLVMANIFPASDTISIEVFKLSTLGEQLYSFFVLAEFYSSGKEAEEMFLKTGNEIYSVLQMFDREELDPLIKLLTDEEQEAYGNFYRISTMNTIIGRANGPTKTLEEVIEMRKSESVNGLLNMFNMSTSLGIKGTDKTRTNNYVFKKCMEELGEMALEDNIAEGLSYKDSGSDGVAGEAVDLSICAMDMFALQHPEKTAEEIQHLFLSYMNKKLQKWKDTLK